MLKLIGTVIVVVSAFLVGLLKRENLKRRERELKDFIQFLSHLEDAFCCLQSRLADAVEGARIYCETDLQCLLGEFLARLRLANGAKASDAWQASVENSNLALNFEDFEMLKTFGKGLDGRDFEAQKRNILFTKRQAEKRLEDAEQLGKTNGKLSVQLSVLGSIVIVLLLI